jgi:hypothetical protein
VPSDCKKGKSFLRREISHENGGEKIRTLSFVTQVGYLDQTCLIWYFLSRKSPYIYLADLPYIAYSASIGDLSEVANAL